MPQELQEWRRSYIARRAEELALSGAFKTRHAIEVALRRQGHIEAHEVLSRPQMREWISAMCTPPAD